jgi:putative ABC transport system ATP-binding protein
VSIIRARELIRTYGSGEGRVEALAGVSLDVEEWVSVMGPSGSGKSTLMNVLGLLGRPDSGSYSIDGRDVSTMGSRELARARREEIGFVFQSYSLLPRQSARKNVELPMVYAGLGGKERRRRALESLEKVGLSDRADHKPPELSGGQQQRASIARALVNEPAMLLADEPTGNLDSASGGSVLDLFGELNASGITLVVVTHDVEVARRAERVIEIRDGEVFADRMSGSVGVGE